MANLNTYTGWIKVGDCPNGCQDGLITWAHHGIEDEHLWCETCDESLDIKTEDDCRDPSFYITITENELENSNYHSLEGIPTSLFENLAKVTDYSQRLQVAKAIFESFKGL